MRMQLELVVIDLGDTDDPHVIFETLNARGTPLLQSDMIKNKILHDADIGAEDESDASSERCDCGRSTATTGGLRKWDGDSRGDRGSTGT